MNMVFNAPAEIRFPVLKAGFRIYFFKSIFLSKIA